MKSRISSIFASIFLSLSAPAAAQPGDRDVVKVNGATIRQSEVMERLWQRHGPETLEEMVDELLLRQAIQSASVKVSDAEVQKRFSKVREQFSDPKIFETELANAGSSPEKLKSEIREQLSRERLVITSKKLSVTEAELKKTFETHREDLGQREAIHLKHILVKAKSEAEAVVAQVKGGADFGALAREKSLAPTGKVNGGDYGFVSRGMLPAEIDEIAFKMKENELQIIPSGKGFHVLQALERRQPIPAEFAKVKDDLREMMLQEKVKAALPEFMRQLRDKAEIKPVVN